MKRFLTILLCLQSAFGAVTFPINNGVLQSDLNANAQSITAASTLTLGSGSGSARIHILPAGTPTTAVDGIKFGTDVAVYRSATGTLQLSGNLVVTGTISAGNTPITAAGDNIWTGSNTFNGATALSGLVTIGDPGVAFSATGLTATRLALGLRPGVDVQPYSASLTALAALTPSSGAVAVGTGSAWAAQSGATFRSSVGLGSSNTVTFADLVLSGSLTTAGTTTLSGLVTVSSATGSASALTIGTGGTLYSGTASSLTTGGAFSVVGDTTLGALSTTTTKITGSLVFGSAGDANLYRLASNTLKTDGSLTIGGSLNLMTPLGTAAGGTGADQSALVANRFLYTSATGVFSAGTITALGRSVVAASTQADARTALGLGTAATANVPATGNAAINESVLGSDTRLSDSRVPSGSAGGALTGTYPNPTLGASGVTSGSYGTASKTPRVTVDATGRVTAVVETTITGTTPGGSAGGSLTGTYPNPTLAAGSVTLGTTTVGNYVGGLSAGSGITITNPTGAGLTATIATAQDIATAASPTFANLTVSGTVTTGALSLSNLSVTTLTTTGNKIAGVIAHREVHVSPDDPAATDTRTGLNLHDRFRPFATVVAALQAITTSAENDCLLVLHPTSTAYGPISVTTTTDVELLAGTVVQQINYGNNVGTVRLTGEGIVKNASGQGVSVYNSGVSLDLRVAVQSSDSALSVTSGYVKLSAPMESTVAGVAPISVGSSGTLRVEGGASSANYAAGSTHYGVTGTGPVIMGAVLGTNGQFDPAVSIDWDVSPSDGDSYSSAIFSGRLYAGSASLKAAVTSSSALFFGTGTDAGVYRSASGVITATGTLTADVLKSTASTNNTNRMVIGSSAGFYEATVSGVNAIRTDNRFYAESVVFGNPTPIASGGTGAGTVAGAQAALNVRDLNANDSIFLGTLLGGTVPSVLSPAVIDVYLDEVTKPSFIIVQDLSNGSGQLKEHYRQVNLPESSNAYLKNGYEITVKAEGRGWTDVVAGLTGFYDNDTSKTHFRLWNSCEEWVTFVYYASAANGIPVGNWWIKGRGTTKPIINYNVTGSTDEYLDLRFPRGEGANYLAPTITITSQSTSAHYVNVILPSDSDAAVFNLANTFASFRGRTIKVINMGDHSTISPGNGITVRVYTVSNPFDTPVDVVSTSGVLRATLQATTNNGTPGYYGVVLKYGDHGTGVGGAETWKVMEYLKN